MHLVLTLGQNILFKSPLGGGKLRLAIITSLRRFTLWTPALSSN